MKKGAADEGKGEQEEKDDQKNDKDQLKTPPIHEQLRQPPDHAKHGGHKENANDNREKIRNQLRHITGRHDIHTDDLKKSATTKAMKTLLSTFYRIKQGPPLQEPEAKIPP